MTIAADIARCLDPVQLAAGIGMDCDPWQADVLRSDHPRILLNVARQCGKSVTCATKAVHVAVYEPGSLILCSADLLAANDPVSRQLLSSLLRYAASPAFNPACQVTPEQIASLLGS